MAHGIYLKCETCAATIGGEDVTPKQQGIPTLTRFDGVKLRELAALRGWTHVKRGGDYCYDDDYCPNCSDKEVASSGKANKSYS